MTDNTDNKELAVQQDVTFAPLVSRSSSIPSMNRFSIPELAGIEFETIEIPGLPPTVKWTKPGQAVWGKLLSVKTAEGAMQSDLYMLEWKGQEFGVWGSFDIDQAFKHALDHAIIGYGDMVAIVYLYDLDVGQVNPMRKFGFYKGKETS